MTDIVNELIPKKILKAFINLKKVQIEKCANCGHLCAQIYKGIDVNFFEGDNDQFGSELTLNRRKK